MGIIWIKWELSEIISFRVSLLDAKRHGEISFDCFDTFCLNGGQKIIWNLLIKMDLFCISPFGRGGGGKSLFRKTFGSLEKPSQRLGMGLGLCEELVGFKSCTILFPFFHSVHCAFTKYASKWSHLLGWWVLVDTWQSRRARDASCCHWLALVALSSYWPILSRSD